jgi:hypothetical protein
MGHNRCNNSRSCSKAECRYPKPSTGHLHRKAETLEPELREFGIRFSAPILNCREEGGRVTIRRKTLVSPLRNRESLIGCQWFYSG